VRPTPPALTTNRTSPRDDSGKVRRTMLRDERANWLKEGSAFRIMPSRPQAKAG
jgi:bile acid-coenzyme A ligase